VKKLQDTEAAKLAAFLVRVGRPQSPADMAEMEHWVHRLQGAKS
jgi:hypothetical protein